MKTTSTVIAVVSLALAALYPAAAQEAARVQKVEVINKPTEPVPTAAQGTTKVEGKVEVTKAPKTEVTVTNTPAVTVTGKVEVTNLPDTQKVTVTNFPAGQAPAQLPPPVQAGQHYDNILDPNSGGYDIIEVRANGWAKVRGKDPRLGTGNEFLLNLNMIPYLKGP